jgi:hypothetical protein
MRRSAGEREGESPQYSRFDLKDGLLSETGGTITGGTDIVRASNELMDSEVAAWSRIRGGRIKGECILRPGIACRETRNIGNIGYCHDISVNP